MFSFQVIAIELPLFHCLVYHTTAAIINLLYAIYIFKRIPIVVASFFLQCKQNENLTELIYEERKSILCIFFAHSLMIKYPNYETSS